MEHRERAAVDLGGDPGASAAPKDVVDRILADGFEPYATAHVPGVGLVMSFRRLTEEPGTFDAIDLPGQYV